MGSRLHCKVAYLAALVLSALALGQPAAFAQTQSTGLEVLGSANVLKVSAEEGKDTATGYFSLFNYQDEPLEISVKLQAASSEKVADLKVDTKTVEPGAGRRIGVTFSGLEALDAAVTGQLIVTVVGKEIPPVAQAIEITPSLHPAMEWPKVIIIVSFVVALLLGAAVVGNMAKDDLGPLSNPVGAPKWSFSSWATTLTAVGGAFGTVFAGVTLPTFPEQISKESLTALNLLFVVLALLAPFLFEALRRYKNVTFKEEDEGRLGTNGTMLIACTVTLWAVLGQLSAFALLAWELLGREDLAVFAVVVIGGVALLAVRYYLVTMTRMVSRPPEADKEESEEVLDMTNIDRLYLRTETQAVIVARQPDEGSAVVDVPSPQPAPRSWPLL